MFMPAQHRTYNPPSPVAPVRIERPTTAGPGISARWTAWLSGVGAALLMASSGCESTGAESVTRAVGHAQALVAIAKQDVAEVRAGLPAGAEVVAKSWAAGSEPMADPESAREALTEARNKVQDLRVAKSTFFALASPEGVVVRNDREQDLMAGKPLFASFPALAKAVDGSYVETLGSMPEAHGVKGKPDAEWVAAQGIRVGDSARALYVTGWAWSSYAYHLEFALRGQINSELKGTRNSVPLIYVFVIVGNDVYGSPESPEINAQAIAERHPLDHLSADGTFSSLLEVTNRPFALGVRSAPELGATVALGVLRSET
jgi:hypothetical protein